MVMSCMPDILTRSRWRVKEGGVSFWWDRWSNMDPLGDQMLLVEQPKILIKDLKTDNGWNEHLIEELVGRDKAGEVLATLGKIETGKDRLVWTKSLDGQFTTKSAWEDTRRQGHISQWHEWIWHPTLPKKISLNMWLAMKGGLSVDDSIRKVGIPIVSKWKISFGSVPYCSA
ncbi:unnamed protein product [Fraxinus pennsylvanica]|uniref:Reverse transcriptase zinc-binding domain-containing protein n=1 Tax=Fraxinus pennsylvanica TaxID=56036 RepID=A0AAD2A8P1_9LAMI|nr:unnamed protein product [Fraxinus pennsylvanica]